MLNDENAIVETSPDELHPVAISATAPELADAASNLKGRTWHLEKRLADLKAQHRELSLSAALIQDLEERKPVRKEVRKLAGLVSEASADLEEHLAAIGHAEALEAEARAQVQREKDEAEARALRLKAEAAVSNLLEAAQELDNLAQSLGQTFQRLKDAAYQTRIVLFGTARRDDLSDFAGQVSNFQRIFEVRSGLYGFGQTPAEIGAPGIRKPPSIHDILNGLPIIQIHKPVSEGDLL